MRYAYLVVPLLLVISLVGPVLADTATTKTAPVSLTVDMYVALDRPVDEDFTVVQKDAPLKDRSFGGDQHIRLHKNCDVNILLDVTDLNPDPGTLAKGAHALPVDAVSIEDPRGGSQFPNGGHAEQVFEWVWCTENGLGEDVHIDYHWKRNGLCDHTGTYSGTITVTAIGIDP